MKLKYLVSVGLLIMVFVLACTRAGDIFPVYTGLGYGSDPRFDRSLYIQLNYQNNFEMQAGHNSLTYKGQNPAVKAFGGVLYNDHKNAQIDLDSVAAITWPSLTMSDTLTLDGQRKIFYLSSFADHTYDTAYLGVVSRDQAAAIANYSNGINGAGRVETRNFCAKWLPKMVLHKKIADSLLLVITK